MTTLKCRLSEASAAAKALSGQISATTVVDTIVCLDGCETIGAFLAEDLTRAGIYSMNSHNTIYIVTPEYVNSGHLVVRENMVPMIRDKNILLLLASATTGQTIVKAVQALKYYGAKFSGISAIFSAANSDIPEYKTYSPEGCSMCRDGKKIDAFANAYGYSIVD